MSIFDKILKTEIDEDFVNTKSCSEIQFSERIQCPGCKDFLLPRTLKMHRKIFQKPNGVWIEHLKNKEIRPEKLKIEFKDDLIDFKEIPSNLVKETFLEVNFENKDRMSCFYCGEDHYDDICEFNGFERFKFEESFEVCCVLFSQFGLKFGENLMPEMCLVCKKEHFHFCSEFSKSRSPCPNCSSSSHSFSDCQETKFQPFYSPPSKLLSVENLKQTEEYFIDNVDEESNDKFVDSMNLFFLKSSGMLSKKNSIVSNEKEANYEDEFIPKKRKKNFYINRFNMPLIRESDTGIDTSEPKSTPKSFLSRFEKDLSPESKNILLRENSKTNFRKQNGKLTFITASKRSGKTLLKEETQKKDIFDSKRRKERENINFKRLEKFEKTFKEKEINEKELFIEKSEMFEGRRRNSVEIKIESSDEEIFERKPLRVEIPEKKKSEDLLDFKLFPKWL